MNNSPVPTISSVISLINHGATLIDSGYTSEAISTLKVALQESKCVFRLQEAADDKNHNNHNHNHDYDSMDLDLDFGTDLDDFMTKTSACHEVNDTDTDTTTACSHSSFVYRHAIHIPTTACSSTSPRWKAILSTILVFNLALAHHRAAMDNSNSNSNNISANETNVLLIKAGMLYESLFPLLQKTACQGGVGGGGGGGGCVLFTLVALNNLGQVCRSLHQVEKATKCFHQLLSSMIYLIDSCKEKNNLYSCTALDLELFFGSTLYLIFPNSTVAASAA